MPVWRCIRESANRLDGWFSLSVHSASLLFFALAQKSRYVLTRQHAPLFLSPAFPFGPLPLVWKPGVSKTSGIHAHAVDPGDGLDLSPLDIGLCTRLGADRGGAGQIP